MDGCDECLNLHSGSTAQFGWIFTQNEIVSLTNRDRHITKSDLVTLILVIAPCPSTVSAYLKSAYSSL